MRNELDIEAELARIGYQDLHFTHVVAQRDDAQTLRSSGDIRQDVRAG